MGARGPYRRESSHNSSESDHGDTLSNHKDLPLYGEELHKRAEKILAEALTAQGRQPDAYTADEYLLAVARAEEDLDPTASTKRLLAEMGLSPDVEDDIATPIGNGLWRLHGKVLTGAELDAQLAEDAITYDRRERMERELRDLGID
jgi:hypothetical protein